MEYKETLQVADVEVSKRKFASEINKFQSVEGIYRSKGIICSKILFPDIYLIFAIQKLNPPMIAFSVRINFTNYDFEPPSVVFINPFTHEPVRRDQIPIAFIQINSINPFQPIDLLQGNGNMVPFICIPGIREYHNHSAHSGDSWFLYRTRGEGTLLFIIDQLYNYSIANAKTYQLNLADLKIKIHQEIKVI